MENAKYCPKQIRNIAMQNNAYGTSLNAPSSSIGPDFLGGSRGLSNAQYAAPTASMMNAIALTVHANPIRGSSCLAIVGYTSPPVADPLAMIANATLRFREKYVVMSDMAGANCMPLPRPFITPCARNNCQYRLHRLVMNMPSALISMPGIMDQ
ncbi:hypothetical protein N0V83_000103 [Neocucurbitaria cava]|uniref:Uncharacterized protein n=1 Tax=Neocucurbitaria cava TaxID=798079 RepID=A0A9W8YG16_9PLEO|nr:hypothetical protein N0V83_000103 [Neocucurbitaria cava]